MESLINGEVLAPVSGGGLIPLKGSEDRDNAGFFVETGDLYDAYQAWAKAKQRKLFGNAKGFGNAMKKYALNKDRQRNDGGRPRGNLKKLV